MSVAKRKFHLQLAGLVILFFALEWAASTFVARTELPYVLSLLAYILPTLPLFGIFPLAIIYQAQSKDKPSSARRMKPVRRYMMRLAISMFLYVVFLMASIIALNQFALSVQIKVLLGVLTALPIGGVIWAMARFIADPDVNEFERMILTRSLLMSTALTLFFAALWGFLENFADAPDFPLYLLVPVFFGLFGLVQPFIRRGFK